MRRGFIILTIILSCASSALAQGKFSVPRSHDAVIHFRLDRADVDSTYSQNRRNLKALDQFATSSGFKIDSIIIVSLSSPEGSYTHNIQLARKRAENMSDFFKKRNGNLAKLIASSQVGESWELLRRAIVEDQKLSEEQKKQALDIIDDDIEIQIRKYRLRKLPFYDYLKKEYYNNLRFSAIRLMYHTWEDYPELEIPEIEDFEYDPGTGYLTLDASCDSIAPMTWTPAPKPAGDRRIPIMEFRTNLLLPALNAGLEIPLGNHWSIGANYYYPWIWPKKDNKNCVELLGWTLDARYWFGRNRQPYQRLLGHSIGLNTYAGYYDLEKDYRGMQGEFVSAGLEYRYALALGKKRWGHLNFSLTVGYLYSEGRTYDVKHPGGPLHSDDNIVKFSFIGPTKAEVSLTIPIYHKKEGRR